MYSWSVSFTHLNFLTVWSECFLRMEAIFLLINETFDSCILGILLRDISSSLVSREASTKFWVDLELADDCAELLRDSSPPDSVAALIDPRADSWSQSPEDGWLSDLSKEQAPSSVQVTGAITLIYKSNTVHPWIIRAQISRQALKDYLVVQMLSINYSSSNRSDSDITVANNLRVFWLKWVDLIWRR